MRWSRLSGVAALWWASGIGKAQAPKASGADRNDIEAGRPNIVMLIADDLGWTDLHTGATSYGNGSRYYQTPNIDALAKEGMSFSSEYTCPNCAPARAALMTGQYAVHSGIYNVGSLDRGKGLLTPPEQREHILPEAVTIAETLRAAGYTTCHVAKFHVATHEEITAVDGFDFNYGGGRAGDGSPHGYFAIKKGDAWSFRALGPEMDQFATPYTREYISKELAPYATGNDPSTLAGTPKHLTDATVDAAIDFLQKHRQEGKPFYLNVGFNAVHIALRSRPDLLAKWKKIPSTDRRHQRADYAALIEGEDQAIARILRYLDVHGLAKNTVVVFWSDNGGYSGSTNNAPLRGSKGEFYEGGIRVPLIVRWPGHIKTGTTSDAMISGVDFYPTFAELAGAKLPDKKKYPLDGYSFAGTLLGKKVRPRPPIFYHFPGYLDTRAYPCSLVVETTGGKRYKLLYSYEDEHYELYDLSNDLGEQKDLLQDGKAAAGDLKMASAMRNQLCGWLKSVHPAWPTVKKTGKPAPFPVELAEEMKSGNRIMRTVSATRDEGE